MRSPFLSCAPITGMMADGLLRLVIPTLSLREPKDRCTAAIPIYRAKSHTLFLNGAEGANTSLVFNFLGLDIKRVAFNFLFLISL